MHRGRSLVLGVVLSWVLIVAALPPTAAAQSKPEGEMRWALYVTLSPVWFDPAEVSGQLTPFWVLYALHDALVKPMPGNLMAPSLAESWTLSADQRTYEFKLREGLKFHNGDPFTAEDVKFSFHRAKGSKILHDRVREVTVVGPSRVRFTLTDPWPDFMAFYGTMVSGAGWIVPKKYVEQVGNDGFKKHPIGLGPYKFVSHTPGIELVMEANESYWRKMPLVKRLVFKSVPESTTRLAMLKRGEVDVAYLLEVPQAQEVKKDPNLRLAFSGGIATFFFDFLEQWDPKSPWADRRVRLAANYAIDRQALSDAETLGASRPAGNHVPRTFEFALPLEPYPYDPAKAKQLLAEAGYPNGLTLTYVGPDSGQGAQVNVAVQASLARAGIKLKITTLAGSKVYTDSLGLPAKRAQHQIGQAAWCFDYPGDGTRSFMVPLIDGRSIQPANNSNYSEYNNPAVNAKIDQALAEGDRDKRAALWAEVDRQAMQDAVWAPFLYDKTQLFWSARLRNWKFTTWGANPELPALWIDQSS
jgi:peptide/nickel transport system substrate-binding protein